MAFEVYVHVPFCLRRCGYCDFNTFTGVDLGGGASRGNYANMVLEEIALVARWQREQGIIEPPAATVFFGGGTPTVLSAEDMARMLEGVRATWGIAPGAEITTEANPDTVDEAYIERLAQAGFTRISFGMQSAVPHVLATLDRTHTPANVVAGVKAAKKVGLRSSVDLIYGAPGESIADWRTSLDAALDLGVQHISAYALTIEPHTKMGRLIAAGKLPKPQDDDEAAKYELADAAFSAAGLQWYEISNWAQPGFESEHNSGYWRGADWAGIGPGAHSHYGKLALRAWDIRHPRLWGQRIASGQVPWQGEERLNAREQLEELIMLGLRMVQGLDVPSVQAAALKAGLACDQRVAAQLEREGLVTMHGSRMVATLRGRLLNDTLIERLFAACGM